jgi:hypothetical protein
MFGISITTQLESVAVKVKANGPAISRRVIIKLGQEFDFAMAAALGPDAMSALTALKSKGISKCTLPINAIGANGKMRAANGESVKLVMRGIKCEARMGKETDDPPTCTLEFEMPWHREAWIFFGEHATAWVEVNFKKEQLSLFPGEEADPDGEEADKEPPRAS